ncbi:MAG TPA: hypothetical protein VMD97_01905 [Candidatus Aquilonibacter sp.]|nr:hypothetical protein [Candidatus Aquilonibacter sp.]
MAGLNVSKWQPARREWNYTPVMQLAMRLIRTAIIEVGQVENVPCPYVDAEWETRIPQTAGDWMLRLFGEPWDRAVMARDWIRRGAPDARLDREGYLLSFDNCCDVLGLNADAERTGLLSWIDSMADFDTDEVWARIEYLTQNPPDESEEPLFDAPRVVPELDQGCLFAQMEAA